MPLRPSVRGEPGLVRDYGGVKRGEFGALLDLLAVLVAGVDLGVSFRAEDILAWSNDTRMPGKNLKVSPVEAMLSFGIVVNAWLIEQSDGRDKAWSSTAVVTGDLV
ncbi:hypothetical protein ROHU_017148 [Labeo rohita]|uniref:Uncharacterized protein n=1 Tax=Labeo rohita TaxID=84645 RepID=A0A498NH66_LABRO|nr:hypothetical protein ROHU_017148 [Labeo rohita]